MDGVQVFCAEVHKDNRCIKSGFFLLTFDEATTNLVALVKTGAANSDGIGRIYHQNMLMYECDKNGRQTNIS